jgi:hypothetical protein
VTLIVPEEVAVKYRVREAPLIGFVTLQLYVPLRTLKVIVEVVEDSVVPPKVALHDLPEGNPLSVKTTA